MRKPASIALTVLLLAIGSGLLAMAAAGGALTREAHRAEVMYALAGCFLALFLLGLIFPALADSDYRKALRTVLLLLALGMFMIYVFIGFVWMVAGSAAAGLSMKVLLPLYGIALAISGVLNHFSAQEAYRPYIFSLARELPYIYYRYRI